MTTVQEYISRQSQRPLANAIGQVGSSNPEALVERLQDDLTATMHALGYLVEDEAAVLGVVELATRHYVTEANADPGEDEDGLGGYPMPEVHITVT